MRNEEYRGVFYFYSPSPHLLVSSTPLLPRAPSDRDDGYFFTFPDVRDVPRCAQQCEIKDRLVNRSISSRRLMMWNRKVLLFIFIVFLCVVFFQVKAENFPFLKASRLP